jgi:hypothetical protein
MTILGLLRRFLAARSVRTPAGAAVGDAEPALNADCMALLDHLQAAAYAAGRDEERMRIAAIMHAPVADMNRGLALHLALQSGLSPAAAQEAITVSLLASLPVATGEDGAVRCN